MTCKFSILWRSILFILYNEVWLDFQISVLQLGVAILGHFSGLLYFLFRSLNFSFSMLTKKRLFAMEASYLLPIGFPRSFTVYFCLISLRTRFLPSSSASLALLLHNSLISYQCNFDHHASQIPQIASDSSKLRHFCHMALCMKSNLSHLLVFYFLGIQLTFWPFVLPVVVVSTLLTYWLWWSWLLWVLNWHSGPFCSSFIRFGTLTFPLCYGT